MNNNSSKETLYAVAYAFMIITTVITSFTLIAMAWMIPMTLATKNAMNESDSNDEKEHIALGVCSLLFASIISGILILVASSTQSETKEDQKLVEVIQK